MVRVRYSFGSRHTGRIGNIRKQRGKYPDVMKDVVRISDIVLEILDARYIGETRNMEVEEDILAKGKKLIYVFNKVDLLGSRGKGVGGSGDNENAIKELEAQVPSWMRPYVFVSATRGIGLREIKARIKMEAKRISSKFSSGCGGFGVSGFRDLVDKKGGGRLLSGQKVGHDDVVKGVRKGRRVHVGVIGYPNAGKSSVINFITRRGVAKTAKQAGFTKGIQKIRMSEDILILDTPGVIPASKYSTESKNFAEDVKVGGRSAGDVRDPEGAVFFLMKENAGVGSRGSVVGDNIERFYGIDAGGDVEVLIEELGRKKGFLVKGGEVDEDRTARLILRDWQEGKISKKFSSGLEF